MIKLETLYKKLGLEYPFYNPYKENEFFLYYPRQSGRTTEMLLKALKKLLDGNDVIVVGDERLSVIDLRNIMYKYLKRLKRKITIFRDEIILKANKHKIGFISIDEFFDERVGCVNYDNIFTEVDYNNVFIDHMCLRGYDNIQFYIKDKNRNDY